MADLEEAVPLHGLNRGYEASDGVSERISSAIIGTEKKDHDNQLHSAIKNLRIYTIQNLLTNDADVNVTTPEGLNSVHLACQYANIDILYLLISRGGDVNAKDENGRTPIMVATEYRNDGCISILANAGANLDEKNNQGDSPLIVAASDGSTNTVKELLLNGASFDVKDENNNNALQRALLNKSDGAAANIIRLALKEEYLINCIDDPEVGLLKIVRLEMKETMKAILDHALVQHPTDPHLGVVRARYIDFDITAGNNPYELNNLKKKKVYLKRLLETLDEEIAYNGTVRVIVEKKMKQIGNVYLTFKMIFHSLYLVALAYSLIQASYENSPLDSYFTSPANLFRIITESYVVSYFIYTSVSEILELYRTFKNRIVLNKEKGKEIKNAITIFLKLKFAGKLCLQVIGDYFSDLKKYFDAAGLMSLLILIILRVSRQPAQWEFAVITNLINSLRFFNLIALLPSIGPYAAIFFKILKREVPQFILFCFYVLIFATSYFIALRVPYTAEGFRNESLMQDTDRVPGVDNNFYWVFVTGFRILLEGNVYQDQYTYRHLNWSAAMLYMIFIFITVVLFLNVFIAHLADIYSTVRENADRMYAWNRLSFVVEIQRHSLLSFFKRYKKRHCIGDLTIDKDEMLKYYGVQVVRDLNVKYYTENVEVRLTLAHLQNQQSFARKAVEISKSNAKVQQMELRDTGGEKVNELKEKIETLTTSMTKLVRDLEEREVRQEEKFTKSIDDLMKLIQEKLQ